MALKKCFECGKEVSVTATKCPNCGAHNPTKNVEQNIGEFVIVAVIVAGALLVLIWAANSGMLPESWVGWLDDVGILRKLNN